MSLSKELSEAKILAKKINDAQREIRAKTLALKIGQQEQTTNISSFLKPVSEQLEKIVKIKEKKDKTLETMRDRYLSSTVKREPISSLRLLPSLLKKPNIVSPSSRRSEMHRTEYTSPLSNWDFDAQTSSGVQTPTSEEEMRASPLEIHRSALRRRRNYNQMVFAKDTPSPVQEIQNPQENFSNPSTPTEKRTVDETVSKEQPGTSKESMIDKFFDMSRSKALQIDRSTGIKTRGNKTMLGKKEIEFHKRPFEYFRIEKTDYPVTEGLMELLFLKQPNQEIVTQQDERNYKKIINQVNLEPITNKVLQYGTGLMLDSDRDKEYVYFNDPNELVERLLLLKRSQAAGNTFAHNNEIMSILEELREGGYIF